MIVREHLDFERGQDPKISMDIGNKWTHIKVGDIIECTKEVIVERRDSGEFLTFKDYISGAYLGDRDYYFSPGNMGLIKTIVDLQEAGLRITIIPAETIEELEGINLNKPSSSLFYTTKGTAPISIWAKYFKVL